MALNSTLVSRSSKITCSLLYGLKSALINFRTNWYSYYKCSLFMCHQFKQVTVINFKIIIHLYFVYEKLTFIKTGFAYLLGVTGLSLFAIAILSYMCVPPTSTTENLYSNNNNTLSSCTGSLSPKRDIRWVVWETADLLILSIFFLLDLSIVFFVYFVKVLN